MLRRANPLEELDYYISQINGAKTLEEVLSILQKQINVLGFDRMTYWLRWHKQESPKPVLLSTYPSNFLDHYAESNFQNHDMVGEFSNKKSTPFTWSDIAKEAEITKVQKILFSDSSSVGLRSGGSIPIHGPHNVKATFSVANDTNNKEFDQLFNLKRFQLQILATYAHEKIISLGIDNVVKIERITPREKDILSWVARGKTYWEISKILSIQEDTVRKHMKNVLRSMNASNSSHAIARAIMLGIIIP